MGSIWTFPVCSGLERIKDENNIKIHNTQKPEALIYRLIVLFTNRGDLILDPFGGTMTTAAVAIKTGRNYTMLEREEKYIKYGEKRLENLVPSIGFVEEATFDIKPAKVPFKEMVENNYFHIGEEFVHKNGEIAILVDDTGKIKYKEKIASMHEIAGLMMGSHRRVNAFDYLFVRRDNNLVSINEIRNKYRIDNNLSTGNF